jgi:quercetin dioxygenase-like cupin family protein
MGGDKKTCTAQGSRLPAGHRPHTRQGLTLCRERALGPRSFALLFALIILSSAPRANAQAVGGADKARPVAGDPGISSMVVMDQPEFRVLRDYAEPGATRRMHSHDDATWHVFTLVTGQLLLTIDGEAPVEVTQGQVLSLKGGAKHTFKNTGTVTATIVEVFGKAPKP